MKHNIALIFAAISLAAIPNFVHSMDQDEHPVTAKLIRNQKLGDIFESQYKEAVKEIVMKAQRPNEICVSMWDKNCIKMHPTNIIPLTLSANIAGCMAAILLVRYNNNEQYAEMTHYPDLSRLSHCSAIENLCTNICSTHNETKQITSINFFVTLPIIPESTTFRIDEMDMLHYNSLQNCVQDTLHKISPVTTHLIPYDIKKSSPLNLNKPRDFSVILYPDKASIISNNGNQHIDLPLIK